MRDSKGDTWERLQRGKERRQLSDHVLIFKKRDSKNELRIVSIKKNPRPIIT